MKAMRAFKPLAKSVDDEFDYLEVGYSLTIFLDLLINTGVPKLIVPKLLEYFPEDAFGLALRNSYMI